MSYWHASIAIAATSTALRMIWVDAKKLLKLPHGIGRLVPLRKKACLPQKRFRVGWVLLQRLLQNVKGVLGIVRQGARDSYVNHIASLD